MQSGIPNIQIINHWTWHLVNAFMVSETIYLMFFLS